MPTALKFMAQSIHGVDAEASRIDGIDYLPDTGGRRGHARSNAAS
jgi:hypothetical protein